MIELQRLRRSAVVLMAAASDGTGQEAPDSPQRGTGAGLNPRVLIVEDEALVAMNIESALAEAGFDVLGTVDTEADAVAAAERMRPDVILIDITLRDGDGISAAKTIQEKLKTRIIFMPSPLLLARSKFSGN